MVTTSIQWLYTKLYLGRGRQWPHSRQMSMKIVKQILIIPFNCSPENFIWKEEKRKKKL